MTYPGIENDRALLDSNPDLAAVVERRAAREEEYGTWVAKDTIPWGTVIGFVKGSRVPNSTVERLKWDELGLVVKRSTKEGREILESTDDATTEERERWAAEDKAAAERAAKAKADAEAAKNEPKPMEAEAPAKSSTAKSGTSAKGGTN